MTHRIHAIAVKQLPEILTLRQERAFLVDLEPHLRVDRPRIVLDCSGLLKMDRAALQLIVFCLEEAMKRNGDVKLAGLTDASIEVLDRTGVLNLFQCYNSTGEAVTSFRRISTIASHAAAELGDSYRSEAAAQVA
jgi:anti-sigma B factor antagonist